MQEPVFCPFYPYTTSSTYKVISILLCSSPCIRQIFHKRRHDPCGISASKETESSMHWPRSTHWALLPPSWEKLVTCWESQVGRDPSSLSLPILPGWRFWIFKTLWDKSRKLISWRSITRWFDPWYLFHYLKRKAKAIYQTVSFLSKVIFIFTLNFKPNNSGNGPQVDWLKGESETQNDLKVNPRYRML